MKSSNSLKIINTRFILSQNQQARYRDRLKQLLKNEGIISICLEDRSLFVEYEGNIINIASIMNLLSAINFPMKEQLIESKKDFALS
jgi:hypothetical protein